MRLIQATCTIIYTGRCDTYLPEADRLIIIKDDGSVAVHVDSGFKPLNYMKASKELMMVEKADGVYLKAANTKESLLIQMLDIKADIFLDFPDSERDMVKTGTEDNLQEYISNNMAALIPGYIPVCREFETGKGPVDVFGMTEERDGVALIEVKRHAHRKDVYQVVKYSNGLDEMVASARNEGIERIEAKRKGDVDGTGTMLSVDAIENHAMFLAARAFSRGTREEAASHGVTIVEVAEDYERLDTTIAEMESFEQAAHERKEHLFGEALENVELPEGTVLYEEVIEDTVEPIRATGKVPENAIEGRKSSKESPLEPESLPDPVPEKPHPARIIPGNKTALFLSIKPQYGEEILEGSKTVEYRRKKPTKPCSKIYLYESKPVGQVVGECSISGIETLGVDEAWETTGHMGGIDEVSFRNYFDGQDECVCIFLDSPKRFEVPLSFSDFGLSRAPLSFGYVEDLGYDDGNRFNEGLFD